MILIVLFLSSHQGPDSGSKLSQDEFDKRAKRNVEHWISGHIVPVCRPGYIPSDLPYSKFASGIPIDL